MTPALVIEGLSVAAGGKRLIDNLSAHIAPGRLTAIVGPNGAGKSTLLRALACVAPSRGGLHLDGVDLRRLRPDARARRLTYLPQAHEMAWNIGVVEMIALGRFAYGAAPDRLGDQDRQAIDRAIDATGCRSLVGRNVASLSGGEQALACLARVLAADTPVLLADEPVAALDPANQYRIMDCLAARAAAGGMVIAVLHDLSLVAQYADDILWLKDGRLAAHGPATQAELAQHVPTFFGRYPAFAPDGSGALYFRRDDD